MLTMNGEVLRQIPLFESLSNDAREFIVGRLKTEMFATGEVIVRQADIGSSMYIITSGLVKVTKRQKNGTSRELARLQAGDYFGEMSLLAGQPRSADIIAITDTTTLVLCKSDMDEILHEYPTIAVHFSKVLSKRLRDTTCFQLGAKQPNSVISIYSRHVEPLFQSVFAVNLAASFIRELMKQVILVDINSYENELSAVLPLYSGNSASQVYPKSVNWDNITPSIIKHKTGLHILPLTVGSNIQRQTFERDISPLLEKLRQNYDYILINCAKEIRKLIHTALEQSDLIIYLTPTSENAIQRCKKDVDLFIQGYGETNNLIIGVLKEEQRSVPERSLEEALAPHTFLSIHKSAYVTERFLKTGRPFVYEYPKSPISRSIQHLTRKIGRVRIGLALGSGSARGFAHVGVLKVLEAYDIPIDMITGSSMGAFVGGFYAAGVSALELEEMVLSYRNKRKVRRTVFDITIPRYGFSKGNRLSKFMRGSLGDVTFDELPIPFIAVATDISNGREVVLRNGIVWKALRASGSVPVMFEPYFLDGRYLIDGGITNPLPTDILIEQDVDIIISCTVNSLRAPSKQIIQNSLLSRDPGQPLTQQTTLPAVDRKYGIIDALTRSLGIMSATNTIQKARLADVDIRPNVSYIDWIDFHRGDELLKEGEEAAKEAMPAILELLHGKN